MCMLQISIWIHLTHYDINCVLFLLSLFSSFFVILILYQNLALLLRQILFTCSSISSSHPVTHLLPTHSLTHFSLLFLQQLQHDNLVNLIETFRRRKRLYLVFEFVDHTVLDELEKCPNGLDENTCRKILWQVLKGTEFCHHHNVSLFLTHI